MKYAALTLFIGALGIVGAMDFNEQHNQHEHYCDMVDSGAWPDYKHQKEKCNNAR